MAFVDFLNLPFNPDYSRCLHQSHDLVKPFQAHLSFSSVQTLFLVVMLSLNMVKLTEEQARRGAGNIVVPWEAALLLLELDAESASKKRKKKKKATSEGGGGGGYNSEADNPYASFLQNAPWMSGFYHGDMDDSDEDDDSKAKPKGSKPKGGSGSPAPKAAAAPPAKAPDPPKAAEAPKTEAPKAEAPKAETPKAEAPKVEKKAEAPKDEAPAAEPAPEADGGDSDDGSDGGGGGDMAKGKKPKMPKLPKLGGGKKGGGGGKKAPLSKSGKVPLGKLFGRDDPMRYSNRLPASDSTHVFGSLFQDEARPVEHPQRQAEDLGKYATKKNNFGMTAKHYVNRGGQERLLSNFGQPGQPNVDAARRPSSVMIMPSTIAARLQSTLSRLEILSTSAAPDSNVYGGDDESEQKQQQDQEASDDGQTRNYADNASSRKKYRKASKANVVTKEDSAVDE